MIRNLASPPCWLALGLFLAPPSPPLAHAASASSAGADAQARAFLTAVTRAYRSDRFTARGCARVPGRKWGRLVLAREPVVHELRFGKECDVAGTLRITLEPFPVELEVRDLGEVRRVTGTGRIVVTPRLLDQQVDLEVRFEDARGYERGERELLSFFGNYGVALGLDGKLAGNRGGELSVTRYRGQVVTLTEPLRFDPPAAKRRR